MTNTYSKSYGDYTKIEQQAKKIGKFVKEQGITREQLNVFLVRFGDKAIKTDTIEQKIHKIARRFYDGQRDFIFVCVLFNF